MASTVGELFISLGIKGSEKTLNAVGKVGQGMSELKSSSLAAKASVLAAVYAVERMMMASAQAGTTLTNTSKLLGIETIELQRYQFAARQAGASNEEMSGSFMALQNAMTQVRLNKGLPEGLKFIANTIGGIDITKIDKLPYLMERLQKFAQSAVPAGVKRWALGTTGLGQGIIAAMERNAFTPDMLNKAPAYSDGQVKQLDRVNIAMENLKNKVGMAFGKFTIKHGAQMVNDIDQITTAIMKLAEALERVSEQTGFFGKLGNAITGVANSIKLLSEVIDLMGGQSLKKGDILYQPPEKEMLPGWKGSAAQVFIENESQGLKSGIARMMHDIMGTPLPAAARPAAVAGPPTNININQNITHVGDAKDTRAVGNLHKAAAKTERSQAYRSNPAQVRGN